MKIELTPRQVAILEQMGLPTSFDALNITQQNAILSIEKLLVYLEDKYNTGFTYLEYVDASPTEDEHLTAYPADGTKDQRVTVYHRYRDGVHSYEDDYDCAQLVPTYKEEVRAFLSEYVDTEHVKLFCKIWERKEDVTQGNVAVKVSGSVYIFLDESFCTAEQFEDVSQASRQWLIDNWNGMRGSIILLRTKTENMADILPENYENKLWEDYYSTWINYTISDSGNVNSTGG